MKKNNVLRSQNHQLLSLSRKTVLQIVRREICLFSVDEEKASPSEIKKEELFVFLPFAELRKTVFCFHRKSKNRLKGGSPVQTLLKTTRRPGQIQNAGTGTTRHIRQRTAIEFGKGQNNNKKKTKTK